MSIDRQPIRTWPGRGLAGIFVLSVIALAGPIRAADPLPGDLELLRKTGSPFVALRQADLLNHPLLKLLPPILQEDWQDQLKGSQKALGVDPSLIERVSLCFPSLDSEALALVRTVQPIDRIRIIQAVVPNGKPMNQEGGTLVRGHERSQALFFVDDQVFLVGTPSAIEAFRNRPGRDNHPGMEVALKLAAERNHLVIGAPPWQLLAGFFLLAASDVPRPEEPTPTRPDERPAPPPPPPEKRPPQSRNHSLLESAVLISLGLLAPEPTQTEILDDLPFALIPYRPLFQARYLALGLHFDRSIRLEGTLFLNKPEDSDDTETALRSLLFVVRELLTQEIRASLDEEVWGLERVQKLVLDLQKTFRTAPIEKPRGLVTLRLGYTVQPEQLAGVRADLNRALLPRKSQANLREIGLALHGYHDIHGGLPLPAIYDAQKAPLLSWRVALLPLLGEEKLYKEFRLNEPWDSEHNKKLLPRMPKVYVPPTGKADEGKTYYRVVVGREAIFSEPANPAQKQGTRIQQIQDGSSNTIMVLEAADAVPWTKPEELELGPGPAVPRLGGMFPTGSHALLGDGAVIFLKKGLNPQRLREMLTSSGGENPVLNDPNIEWNLGRTGRFPLSGSAVPKP